MLDGYVGMNGSSEPVSEPRYKSLYYFLILQSIKVLLITLADVLIRIIVCLDFLSVHGY